jgi:LmbE family N-acetylglucosaminyl deacetylase
MMKRFASCVLMGCLVFLAFPFFTSGAQVQELQENRGAAAAWRALLRLRSTATVLHTTAHPDDEDAALLTWLSRKAGVRTGLLTLNRGEGGANLIGPELYDALGVLRTEELLAAGRYYGVDQMFTRVADFGFSKRMDETLEHWGKETVLNDVVHAIRMYRPDVIVSRFHGTARDGHGNHQAAGLLSIEAFKAAADPNRFPEHFKEGLRPWQVKKFYLSLRESEPGATLKIDVGEYDPLLGRSYREIAADGYRLHRSQSVGQSRPAPGQSFSSVQLAESSIPKVENEQSLFDGIDTTIAGMSKLAGSTNISSELTEINTRVEAAISKFNALKPWSVAPDLAAGTKATRALIEKLKAAPIEAAGKDHLLFLLNNKEREFNDAMNKALSLVMEVLVDPEKPAEGQPSFFQSRETFAVAIPGQKFSLTVSVTNRSPVKLERGDVGIARTQDWEAVGKPPVGDLPVNNSTLRAQFEIKVPDNAEYTRPHWSRANELRDHVYQINKPERLHDPFPPPELFGVFGYEVEGARFFITCPAQTVYIDRPWGEQRRLLTVAPAMNVGISPRVGVIPIASSQTSFDVSVSVSNNVKGNAAGKVRLKLPGGWSAAPAESNFSFTHEGEAGNFNFKVSVPQVAPGVDYKVQAVAEFNGKEYAEGYQVIAHRDNEPRRLYRAASMDVRGIEAQVAPNLSVGYVMGVGDEVPKALEQIGVKVVMLGENDLAKGNLDGFDAIIVGIRATAVRDDLKAYSKRLLEYCERGGNLIYQYQTQEFDGAPYGPFPYKLGARAEEVSEEDAKVTVLDPANPVFNWPNKIAEADFQGWVEERGSKWMTTWDERYTPLLESHDRQQPPQRGGLMYARHGKGTFVYAAYAFYRQLPAGVQGGYRLFANIISLKKQPR